MTFASWTRRALMGASALSGAGGVVAAALGIWLFVELSAMLALRDTHYNLYNERVYWAQVAPWLYFGAGLATAAVAVCGWLSARAALPRPLALFAWSALGAVCLQVVAAALAIHHVDQPHTDDFVLQVFYDAYHGLRNDVRRPEARAFAAMESALRCCGVRDASDYRGWVPGRSELPSSCCGDPTAVCDFYAREPNERQGCALVAGAAYKEACTYAGAAVVCLALPGLAAAALAWRLRAALDDEEDGPADDEYRSDPEDTA